MIAYRNSEVAHAFAVEPVDAGYDHAINSGGDQLARASGSGGTLEISHSRPQFLHFGNSTFDGIDEFVGGDTHGISRSANAFLIMTEPFDGSHA